MVGSSGPLRVSQEECEFGAKGGTTGAGYALHLGPLP